MGDLLISIKNTLRNVPQLPIELRITMFFIYYVYGIIHLTKVNYISQLTPFIFQFATPLCINKPLLRHAGAFCPHYVERYGCRPVAMVGFGVAGVMICLASFSERISTLALLYAIAGLLSPSHCITSRRNVTYIYI